MRKIPLQFAPRIPFSAHYMLPWPIVGSLFLLLHRLRKFFLIVNKATGFASSQALFSFLLLSIELLVSFSLLILFGSVRWGIY